MAWARGFKQAPEQTFVVHGEASAAQAFAELLQQQLGWQVAVPEHGQVVPWPDFLAVER